MACHTLVNSCLIGDGKRIKDLLNSGISIQHQELGYYFVRLCEMGCLEGVVAFLDKGFDINTTLEPDNLLGQYAYSALMGAIMKNQEAIVRELINRGVNVRYEVDIDGIAWTCFMLAREHSASKEILDMLLKAIGIQTEKRDAFLFAQYKRHDNARAIRKRKELERQKAEEQRILQEKVSKRVERLRSIGQKAEQKQECKPIAVEPDYSKLYLLTAVNALIMATTLTCFLYF
jgi:hypothetical protein